MAAGRAAVARPARQRPLPRWPLLALFVGFPVWWLLGLGALIWPVLALPMLGALVIRGRLRVPSGFIIWLGFLLWMLGSGIQLDSTERVLGWAYRAGLYFAATVVFLYVYNTPRDRLPPRTVALTLSVFWLFVVAGGFLGMLRPDGSFTTPVELLLPRDLLANSFVQAMVHPAFAQTAGASLGVAPRPQAPFIYTNEWGANFALLVPMVFTAMSRTRTETGRLVLGVLLPVGMIPAALSLNRGLFLSLGAGLLYAALRYAIRGRVKPLIGITVVVCVAAAVFAIGPARELLAERVANSATNQTRAALYQETVDRVKASPILGYGAPRPSEDTPGAPSAGTQGQLWLVLFSHGYPGAALYVGWYLWALWRTRRGHNAVAFWAHVVVFIGLVQLPYYGALPGELVIVMIAAAVAMREEEVAPRPVQARSRTVQAQRPRTAQATVEGRPA
jgi:hypothetical protein